MLESKLFRESIENERPKNTSMLSLSRDIEIEKSGSSDSLLCSLGRGMEYSRINFIVEL
jgi:hypothetical protein